MYPNWKNNCGCELIQKFHGNKIQPVFSSFQKLETKANYMYFSVVSRLSVHKGAAIQGPDRKNSVVSLNPLPLKEIYSDGLSVGNWMPVVVAVNEKKNNGWKKCISLKLTTEQFNKPQCLMHTDFVTENYILCSTVFQAKNTVENWG